jgi:hypothetical protein
MKRIICPKCGKPVRISKGATESFTSCVAETKEEDEEWVWYHLDPCWFEKQSNKKLSKKCHYKKTFLK